MEIKPQPRIRKQVFNNDVEPVNVPHIPNSAVPKSDEEQNIDTIQLEAVSTVPAIPASSAAPVVNQKRKERKSRTSFDIDENGYTNIRVSNVTLRYIHFINLLKYSNKKSLDETIRPILEAEYLKVLAKCPELEMFAKKQ